MKIVGQCVGVLLAAMCGVVILVTAGGLAGFAYLPGFISAPLGFALAFVLMKYVLWRAKAIRPALWWLYPYESWKGNDAAPPSDSPGI